MFLSLTTQRWCPSAPREAGGEDPLSQHRPGEDPHGVVGPPGPLTLWPAPRPVLMLPPWPRLPRSPLSPPTPTLPDLLEPRPEGAPASTASTAPRLPTALPHPGPQPAMRTGLDPAPARRARALGRAALPSRYLRPLLAPDILSPAPIALALKGKHTQPGWCCTGL